MAFGGYLWKVEVFVLEKSFHTVSGNKCLKDLSGKRWFFNFIKIEDSFCPFDHIIKP